MKKLLFLLLLKTLFVINSFSQSDTVMITVGDTIFTIFNEEPVIPDYLNYYHSNKFKAAEEELIFLINMNENEDNNSYYYYLLCEIYAKQGDSIGLNNYIEKAFDSYFINTIFWDKKYTNLLKTEKLDKIKNYQIDKISKEIDNLNFDYYSFIVNAYRKDSYYRNLLFYYKNDPQMRDSIFNLQDIIDIENHNEINSFIKKNGYPSISSVGEEGMSDFISFIQHMDEKNFAKHKKGIKKLYKTKQITPEQYAYYIDRYLFYRDRKQLYGTQAYRDNNGQLQLHKSRRPKKLNDRRKEMGLKFTSEQYLKMLR